ncbi:MAG TPA: amidohydrolase family protein [Mycobacteriales bacterium]|nr:amidohydrolase family protein [Mycobacteriales bacterium]
MGPLLVRAGSALLGGVLRPATMLLDDGLVVAIDPSGVPAGTPVVDTAVLSPGFVDLHVHALDGAGTIGQPDMPGLSTALARRGVTSFLATTVAAPVAALLPLLEPVTVTGARCVGVHLEGPWLSPAHAGAQPPDALAAPSLADLELLLEAGPPRLLTLAPELPGAHGVITRAIDAGVVVALGHSGATYEAAAAAVALGARHVTHCFNAMSGLHHREPGLAGAALDLPEVTVEVIADGVHLHPAVVRLLWRACGPERVCLVSDAVDLGLPGVDAARLTDGTLAGSRMGLDQAVRNLVAWGVPLADALTMAAVTPGARVGLPPLGAGAPADLVLLSEDLQVSATVVGGQVVWQR